MEEIKTTNEGVPVIEITNEQANLDITLERIDEYDGYVGEDFIDQNETIIHMKMFGGFLMGKHPDKAKELIDIFNSDFGGFWSDIQDVFDDDDEDTRNTDIFYQNVCDFVNLTEATKRRFNIILFSVAAYYGQGGSL